MPNTANLYNQCCFVLWFNKNCFKNFNKRKKVGDVHKIWLLQFLNLKNNSVEFLQQKSINKTFAHNIYRNITTPWLSYVHEHCRNPKKVSRSPLLKRRLCFAGLPYFLVYALQWTQTAAGRHDNFRRQRDNWRGESLCIVSFNQYFTL